MIYLIIAGFWGVGPILCADHLAGAPCLYVHCTGAVRVSVYPTTKTNRADERERGREFDPL